MIIHPFQCDCEICVKIRDFRVKKHQLLQYIYNNEASVKEDADEIHHHRMLGPPTCDQCIMIAARKKFQELTII